MKTQFTLAALILGGALFAGTATAAGTMTPSNTMTSTNTMGAMHPMTAGMMAPHKPKPHKSKPMAHNTAMGGAMAPAGNTMAPTSTMTPANGMGGSH